MIASSGGAVAPDAEAAIRVSDVSRTFVKRGRQVFKAIDDITLSAPRGEFVSIVGPSGCGKTTLLYTLAGLDRPSEGTVLVNGAPPREGDRRVSYVPARDSLLPWRTALDNAALALEIWGVGRRQRYARARESLELFGLAAFERRYPAELSQGMRQRVSLARSFATTPEILLMDEPFSALDVQTRIQVQEAFVEAWERERMTVVLITHDLGEAIALSDRVVMFTRSPGRVKGEYLIDLPRPRDLYELQSNDRYHEIHSALWRDFREEVSVLPTRSREVSP